MARGDLATLVRICDLAGRPRGTGFVADDLGTVVTSHEAVDGLVRVVLHAPGDRTCLAEADAIVPLADDALALIRTEGLGVAPLPVAGRTDIATGTYVRLPADGWREARVLGASQVTYTATDRFHLLGDALELAMGTDAREALRLGGEAAGGPVLDAATGAVLGVLGTALHAEHRAAGFAVPLAAAAVRDPEGPLAALLRRNAAAAPAYGPDLNVAGVLALTATTGAMGRGGGAGRAWPEPVERPVVNRELARFAVSDALVCALVGDPGTGRTTELAAFAARRARGPEPAPTLWLRGADLRADDLSLADAAGRALRTAGRIVAGGRMAAGGGSVAGGLMVAGGGVAGGTDDLPGGGSGPLRAHLLGVGGFGPRSAQPRGSADACGGDPPRPVPPGESLGAVPARVARIAASAGRPLVVLLDGPEEMPPALAQRLPEWTSGTVAWLRAHGVRLVVGCRTEHWERARGLYPAGTVHRPREGAAPRVPDALRLGDLSAREARRARERYGLPGLAVAADDARHPLALRLLAEVREALPADAPGRPGREEIFSAHLDLSCLRVAVRIAAGTADAAAVRRLAARVAGRVHEAARRCLGPGQGELDRAAFEELFPWATGWASAVLTEGLFVPAGTGYRFAHEEVADRVQGAHLDLDGALYALVHRWHEEPSGDDAGSLPVPRHRIGPVLQALLLLERVRGAQALARRLEALADALDRLSGGEGSPAGRIEDAVWWAARLLREVLLRVRDARPYLGVLRTLADRITACSGGFEEFGPWFWEALGLGEDDRLDLLRRLVPADGPYGSGGAEGRFLDVAAARLEADPRGVQPLLCRWFGDERPLPAAPGAHVRPTVAGVAQALLYARRDLAVDDLCEALVTTAHPRADELLAALAEDEPSALCRAVDRWAHDDTRAGRRVAAAAYGRLVCEYVTEDADRELLRFAALALLARPGDVALHGPALGLLVRDPHTRCRHLPRALAVFRSGDPGLPATALAAAMTTHPEPVVAAFRARLREPWRAATGYDGGAAELLGALATVNTPALARRAAALVREYVDLHPAGAVHAAAYVDRRLEQGTAARAVLFPLVAGLLRSGRVEVRSALAPVLAAPGSAASRALRAELLDVLLEYEGCESRDPAVPDALLRAAALGAARRPEARTRELVRRSALLLLRTAEGATRFDGRLVELAREVPGFAALVAGWLAEEPGEWAAVVGPSARRTIESIAGPVRVALTVPSPTAAQPVPMPEREPPPMPVRAESRGHGSLRPA
ncbi:serine protease [Streptomyces sp. NPDC047928]|uniref:serine protease n=1 Tax=unclassified Streptomyces TaxID=2593676 RepID=UPI0037234621